MSDAGSLIPNYVACGVGCSGWYSPICFRVSLFLALLCPLLLKKAPPSPHCRPLYARICLCRMHNNLVERENIKAFSVSLSREDRNEFDYE